MYHCNIPEHEFKLEIKLKLNFFFLREVKQGEDNS